jgi:hypothetical protein
LQDFGGVFAAQRAAMLGAEAFFDLDQIRSRLSAALGKARRISAL